VLRRLMPGQDVPEVNELQEIDTMLAETVDEWTRQWKADGLQQGLLQGLQEGRQKGRQEGRQEGRKEGERVLLQKQLERRFGTLPTWVCQHLLEADPEQLEAWALDLLDAVNLEDIFPAG